jgi:radical SAM protein with 4Fe4S-binding SPASM domain
VVTAIVPVGPALVYPLPVNLSATGSLGKYRLKEAGQKVMIGCHVGDGNAADIPGLVALAAELGVDLKVAPLRPVGRAVRELPPFLIQPRNFYAVVRQLTQLRRKYPQVHIYTDLDILEGPGTSECRRDPARAPCRAGRSMIHIHYDGGIYPCGFFIELGDHFRAGSIYEETATAVWQRPTTFEEFRVQQKSDTCRGCGHYQSRCSGGCPAIAYSTTGHLDALDPTCFADLVEPETWGELRDRVPPLAFAEFVEPPQGGDQ